MNFNIELSEEIKNKSHGMVNVLYMILKNENIILKKILESKNIDYENDPLWKQRDWQEELIKKDD